MSEAPRSPLWVPLTGAGVDAGETGGKGAWLDRLVAEGFPVPSTAVITTAAYRAVAARAELSDVLRSMAGEPPPPEEHRAERERIDRAFSEVPLPDDVAAAIAAASAAARDGRAGSMLAARSSATAEDLHGTSFAGQYRSFLELGDDDAVETAVRLVWASLWHPAPRAYRRFHGIDESSLGMAVVLMRQIPATTAGVAFTADPGGAPDVVRVESVAGLGEQLVSGATTPTVELVPRAPARDGFEARTLEVAALALRVESALGEPQDLEWAYDDEGLWLLQARPITTRAAPRHDGADDDPDARRWTTDGIAEMVPGVLAPLRWQTLRLLVEEALRAHYDALGVLDAVDPGSGDPGLVGRVHGHAVLDADRLEQLASAVRGDGRGRIARSALARRAARARRHALWEGGTVCVAARELIDGAPEPRGLDDHALLAHRRRLVDLGARAMAAEVGVAGAAATAVDRLRRALRRHLDDEDETESWVARVTARPGGTIAGWPAADLEAALRGAPSAAVRSLADADGWSDVERAVAGVDGGAELVSALRRVLHRTGSAAIFGGPTWEEQPERLWPILSEMARHVADGDRPPTPDPAEPTPLDDLLDGLAANPAWRQMRWLTGQIIDVRRAVLRRHAEDAADLLERRERTKGAVLAIGGELRRIEQELGRRLAAGGLLEIPDDVTLLHDAELVAATEGLGPPAVPSRSELARRRRWLERCQAAGPPVATPAPDGPAGAAGAAGAAASEGGDHLQGWGAAPGRVRGHARVLRHVEDGGLHRGDVLVAPATDASWAPLFMTAAAVVVEEGGPLSHAAIVARELGIPAVVHVPGVVARLDGEDVVVTVDGDKGTVTVHPAEVRAARDAASDPRGDR